MADSFHQWLWFNDLVIQCIMWRITQWMRRREFSNLVGLMSGVVLVVVLLQLVISPEWLQLLFRKQGPMLVGGLVRISSWLWIISRLQWNHRKNAEYYAKCMADSFHQWLWFNDLITMHNMENVTRGHERENEFSNHVGLMSGVQSRIWRYHVAELLLLLRNKDLSHACCGWFGSHLAENKSIQSRNNEFATFTLHQTLCQWRAATRGSIISMHRPLILIP